MPKKILFFVVSFLALHVFSYAEKTMVVNSCNGLTVREKPSVKSAIVAVLLDNTYVEVTVIGKEEVIDGEKAAWTKITVGKISGWVFGAYLSDCLLYSEAKELWNTMAITCQEDVRLSKDESVLLKNGQCVQVSSVEERPAAGGTDYWVKISSGKTSGWVLSSYLTHKTLSQNSVINPRNLVGSDFGEVKKEADKNNSLAQYKLAEYYKLGLGTKRNYKEALRWYKKAAEQNEPMAFRLLADFYGLGLGCNEDSALASEYELKAKLYGATSRQDTVYGMDIYAYIPPDNYVSFGLSVADCYSFAEEVLGTEFEIEAAAYLMEAAKNGDRAVKSKFESFCKHFSRFNK